MNYLLLFLAASLLSIILTGAIRHLSLRYGIVKKPRSRDVHKTPMPRLGGIAILASYLLISIPAYFLIDGSGFGGGQILGVNRKLLGIWLGGLTISLVMLIDDIKGLKAWQKLVAQVLVTFILISSGVGLDELANPFGPRLNLNSIYVPIFSYHGIVYHFSLISDALTLIWIVGMMNILNFVDGVDGLASGLSTITAVVITFLALSPLVNQPFTALISIILAGASLGFLFWNFPPAKIFMGDSGSMFLGFMLGALTLISGGKLATVFLVLGFPIIDGLFVALGRILRHKNPLTTPDKTHLHHRFLAAGFSPRQAVLTLYLIALAFGWVALRATTVNKIIAAVALVFLLLILVFVLNILARRKFAKI